MDVRKEPFAAVIIALFVCYALYWGYERFFPTTYVYIDYATGKFHKNPVCDSIQGFDKEFYDELGELSGSEKIKEKDVYYDAKYIMCDFCFSEMDIEYRNEYINK